MFCCLANERIYMAKATTATTTTVTTGHKTTSITTSAATAAATLYRPSTIITIKTTTQQHNNTTTEQHNIIQKKMCCDEIECRRSKKKIPSREQWIRIFSKQKYIINYKNLNIEAFRSKSKKKTKKKNIGGKRSWWARVMVQNIEAPFASTASFITKLLLSSVWLLFISIRWF